jgi:hydroxypyruvate reductase
VTISDATERIESWYKAGLAAVDPRAAVSGALEWNGHRLAVGTYEREMAPDGRVIGLAVGKAANEMALGLTEVLGDDLDGGIILTRDDHARRPPPGWDVYEASHPVPDQRGVDATRDILEKVSGLTVDDTVIVLVSGGGSALLEAPRFPVTLPDIQETTRLLLRAGAPIQHLNAVRSELSEVKGGGLRRAIGHAACISLILSDVLGNDPAVIASGPTIHREPDPETALQLLHHYGLDGSVPESVLEMLRARHEDHVRIDARSDRFEIIGDNDRFIDEIARSAERDGFRTDIVLRRAEGEACDLAGTFLDRAVSRLASCDVVVGGGEATVTVNGTGSGGRNTEFALAAATILDLKQANIVVASLASDGQDGSIDAAGAIVNRNTTRKGASQGLDARRYLDNNDSGGYFERLGALVSPGPTGTNVNDVYIAVNVSPE